MKKSSEDLIENTNFVNDTYLYALKLSGLTDLEFDNRIEEEDSIIEIVGSENHQEFYDTHKDLIHALLIDINDGKYQFLQSSFNEFTRDIWSNVIMKNPNEITTEIPINTVKDYIVNFTLDAVIKIMILREEYKYF